MQKQREEIDELTTTLSIKELEIAKLKDDNKLLLTKLSEKVDKVRGHISLLHA